MAITFVQKTSGIDAFPTATATFGSSVTVGNLLIATVFGIDSTGQTRTVSDNKGNIWTLIEEVNDSTNSGYVMSLWYSIPTTGGAGVIVTISSTSGGFFGRVNIAEYSGNAASPLDKHVKDAVGITLTAGQTSSSSVATGALTQAGELIVGLGLMWDDGADFTVSGSPSGFTDLFQQAEEGEASNLPNAATITKNVTTTASVNPTYTFTPGVNNLDVLYSITASFKWSSPFVATAKPLLKMGISIDNKMGISI